MGEQETVPAHMAAMLLTRLGGVEHIEAAELPVPSPGPGEVLVRVATVAVNRQDINLILGRFPAPWLRLPHVLGLDPAGTVVAADATVTGRRVGDRVVVKPSISCSGCSACRAGEDDACERPRSIGIHRQGGMAGFVAVPAGNAFVLPGGMAFETATAVSHSVPVALTLLRRIGVSAGETVLVSGASGAVGSAAVQLARSMGARVVAGIASEAGSAWLRELPTEIAPDLIVDYGRHPGFGEQVRTSSPGGIDAYVETASDPTVWREAMGTLARRARVAVIGAHAGPMVEVDNNWLFRQRVTIVGCSGSTRAAFAESLELAATGAIRVRIDPVLPVTEAAAAYRRLMARQNQGKVVLRVAKDDGQQDHRRSHGS